METRGRKHRSESVGSRRGGRSGGRRSELQESRGVDGGASFDGEGLRRAVGLRATAVSRGGPKRVVDGVEVSTFRTDLGDERGVMPRERKRRPGSLSASEREEIRVGIETRRVRRRHRLAHRPAPLDGLA